jgi:hypothetical protein
MPVEKLPAASWPTTLALGFVSAVFDNISLTALALIQGGPRAPKAWPAPRRPSSTGRFRQTDLSRNVIQVSG